MQNVLQNFPGAVYCTAVRRRKEEEEEEEEVKEEEEKEEEVELYSKEAS